MFYDYESMTLFEQEQKVVAAFTRERKKFDCPIPFALRNKTKGSCSSDQIAVKGCERGAMGCKNRSMLEENAVITTTATTPSSCYVRDALLFTTMCLIGVPVEVHVKDGSIYTGICHTACFDNDCGIFLKKAKMTKKGKNVTNLENGTVVDALVVSSCDLVQVVAKGILLPSEGLVTDLPSEDVSAIAESAQLLECVESELRPLTSSNTAPELSVEEAKHFRQCWISDQNGSKEVSGLENKSSGDGLWFEKGQRKEDFLVNSLQRAVEVQDSNSTPSAKIKEASVPVAEGQVGKYQSPGKKWVPYQTFDSREDDVIQKVQLADSSENSSFPTQSHGSAHADDCTTSSSGCDNPASVVKPYAQEFDRPASTRFSSDVSNPLLKDVNLSSHLPASQSQTPLVAKKDFPFNTNSKEFKLNPGAKTFMPVFWIPKPAAIPVTTAAASIDFNSSTPAVAPVSVSPPEIGISSFAPHPSFPAKHVPYNNLVAINGDITSHCSQPSIGHSGSRLQSVRYTTQYDPVQSGPAYVHPNSQALMVARLGPLVYTHPIIHDMSQGSAAPFPLLPPHFTPDIVFPKHQASVVPALALQACATQQPPFLVVGGPQPYASNAYYHTTNTKFF